MLITFYKKLKLRPAEEQWVSKSLGPLCQTARQVEGVPFDAGVLWGMIHLMYSRQLGLNYSHPEVSTSLHQSLRERLALDENTPAPRDHMKRRAGICLAHER